MRAFGAGAAIARPLVVVVAIAALNQAGHAQRQDQAGHQGIFPDDFHRMK